MGLWSWFWDLVICYVQQLWIYLLYLKLKGRYKKIFSNTTSDTPKQTSYTCKEGVDGIWNPDVLDQKAKNILRRKYLNSFYPKIQCVPTSFRW